MEEVSCDEEPPEDNIEVVDVVSDKEDKQRIQKNSWTVVPYLKKRGGNQNSLRLFGN